MVKKPSHFPKTNTAKQPDGMLSVQCADFTFAKDAAASKYTPAVKNLFFSPYATLNELLKELNTAFQAAKPLAYEGVSLENVNIKLYSGRDDRSIILDYEKCKDVPLILLGFYKKGVNFVEPTKSMPSVPRTHKYLGLENLGAMCYANSVLQVLFHVPEFREAIIKLRAYDNESSNDTVAYYLHELFMKMEMYALRKFNNFDDDTVSTKALLMKYNGEDAIKIQSDAHEFFFKLIEKLEADFRDVYHQEFSVRSMKCDYDVSTICNGCETQGETKSESSYCISLPINGCDDITECITSLVSEEIEEYDCPKCKKKCTAGRDTTFVFPDTFMLHIARFSKDGRKNPKKVGVPKKIDLDIIGSGDACKKYELFAVIAHNGSVSSGHYVSYVQDPEADPEAPGKWICFNDRKVDEKVEGNIFKDGNFECEDSGFTPYIVVYRRDEKEIALQPVGNDKIDDEIIKAFVEKLSSEQILIEVKFGDRVKQKFFNVSNTGDNILSFAEKELGAKGSYLELKNGKGEKLDPKSTIRDCRIHPWDCLLVEESRKPPSPPVPAIKPPAPSPVPPPKPIDVNLTCKFKYFKSKDEIVEHEVEISSSGTYKDLHTSIAGLLGRNAESISVCRVNMSNPANSYSSFTRSMWPFRFSRSDDGELYVGTARDSSLEPNRDMENFLMQKGSIVCLPVENPDGEVKEFTVEADYTKVTAGVIIDEIIKKSGIPKEQIIIKYGTNKNNIKEVNKDEYPKKLIDAGLYQTITFHVSKSKISPADLSKLGPRYHYAQTRLMEINFSSSSTSVKFTKIGDFPIPEGAVVSSLEWLMKKFLVASGVPVPDDKKILFCYGTRNQNYFPSKIFSPNETIDNGAWMYPTFDLVVFFYDEDSFKDNGANNIVFMRHFNKSRNILEPAKMVLINSSSPVSDVYCQFLSLFEVGGCSEISVEQHGSINSVTSLSISSLKYKRFDPESDGK